MSSSCGAYSWLLRLWSAKPTGSPSTKVHCFIVPLYVLRAIGFGCACFAGQFSGEKTIDLWLEEFRAGKTHLRRCILLWKIEQTFVRFLWGHWFTGMFMRELFVGNIGSKISNRNPTKDFDSAFILSAVDEWYTSREAFAEFVRGPLHDELVSLLPSPALPCTYAALNCFTCSGLGGQFCIERVQRRRGHPNGEHFLSDLLSAYLMVLVFVQWHFLLQWQNCSLISWFFADGLGPRRCVSLAESPCTTLWGSLGHRQYLGQLTSFMWAATFSSHCWFRASFWVDLTPASGWKIGIRHFSQQIRNRTKLFLWQWKCVGNYVSQPFF